MASGDIEAAVAPPRPGTGGRDRAEPRRGPAGGHPGPAGAARAPRLIGALARKGYSPALAYRLTREALEHQGLDLAGAGLDLSDAPDEPADEFADG